MSNLLEKAIYETRKYDGEVDDYMYGELMKYARVGGELGDGARDALATAKVNNYNSLKNVNNRAYDEDTYANLGKPTYY